MNLTKNIIAFYKGLVIPQNHGMDNRIYVSTIQSNLMVYGYMLNEKSFDELSKSDLSFLKEFNDEIIGYLRYMTSDNSYKPLYPNFPNEVMSLSDENLFLNACRHYLSNGLWSPPFEELERPVDFEHVNYTIINCGTEKDFSDIFTSIFSINMSMTSINVSIVEWFIKNYDNLIYPNVIPFKENLCLLYSLGVTNLPIKTVTDVLRIAVYMSGGDISLPSIPKPNRYNKNLLNTFKFKRFKRSERRLILNLLENSNNDVKEMSLKKERWLRLGEAIHPFEYSSQYPKAANMFNLLRNQKVKSWYSLLNDSFNNDFESGLKFLSERPGEFLRRIDFLIRNNVKKLDLILKYLNISLENSSNKVIFELYNFYQKRNDISKNRSIMIKGSRKRTILPDLSPLNEKVIESINEKIIESLKNKFSKLDSLGNCWIDEELKKIPLPSNMRSLNLSLKPIIRGQRTPIGNKDSKVIRAFVHWHDKNGTEDLDLGSIFVSKTNDDLKVLNFTNLVLGKSVHSGDVRHRKGDNAEYIDIDIKDALSRNYKYVVIDVKNYNYRPLNSLNCNFGIMEREFPESNKLWTPETLSNVQKLESDNVSTILCMIDLETLEYIHIDIDTDNITSNGDLENIFNIVKDFSSLPKFSIYDLLLLHVESRGKQVTLDSNIDTYFKLEDFNKSYEKIGEYMGI